MAMLSELLHYRFVDAQGRSARLADVSYMAVGEDYPVITRLYLINGEQRAFDIRDVKTIDHRNRRVEVEDLDAAEIDDGYRDAAEVLLKRDVLDALVIDLLHRTTTRATDLFLREENGELRVDAVDTGLNAMLRRVSRGWYKHVRSQTLIDWKYVEYLKGDPETAENGAGYRNRIARLPAGEIAQLTEYIPYLHAAELLKLLPDDQAADVLEAMPVDQQVQVIEEFDDDEAVELIRRMSPDLAADLVARLESGPMYKYLQELPGDVSARIIDLLRYPEDSVGGVMINDMICVRRDEAISDVRNRLPELLRERDFIEALFVINNEEEKKLVGVVSLRKVLTSDGEKALEDVMFPFLQTLDPFDSARQGAYRIVATQLAALPVVNPDGRLVGAMTIDAATAQLLTGQLQGLRIFS